MFIFADVSPLFLHAAPRPSAAIEFRRYCRRELLMMPPPLSCYRYAADTLFDADIAAVSPMPDIFRGRHFRHAGCLPPPFTPPPD